jgi:hypothetical protein
MSRPYGIGLKECEVWSLTIWLYKVDGIFASVLCLQDVNRFECVKPGEGDGNQQRTTTFFLVVDKPLLLQMWWKSYFNEEVQSCTSDRCD